MINNDRKNRTVLETATRRGHEAFVQILTDSAQIRLMQEESRRERSFEMARIWKLLQLEMATVQLGTTHITIHDAADCFMGRDNNLKQLCHSKRALVLAMTLPAPLVELISDFIPLPLIWEKRLMLLTSRSHVDPDSAVFNALGKAMLSLLVIWHLSLAATIIIPLIIHLPYSTTQISLMRCWRWEVFLMRLMQHVSTHRPIFQVG